ncbi:MAG: hydroxysqualene dehydroxylase HpnE, partial [Planctomycetes bacterium]|nr:hydroxysqualene dehydroxylase HpnE [Planctomycetota bacterium]
MEAEARRTIIVGGGLAGLAAALALGRRGIPVTLLESRPRLGGRASSFLDKSSGAEIDNCQHVTLGCCTNFRAFCEDAGVAAYLREERELYFIGRLGQVNRFAPGRLPAPLHLWPAFRGLSFLDRGDRRAISRGLRALARANGAAAAANGRSFHDWLTAHDQPPAAIERFWHVVLVSALSETLDRVDVGHARKVFVDAFLANRNGWRMQVPTVPLGELYGAALARGLEAAGVVVRLGTGVRQVVLEEGRAAAVELRDGTRMEAADVVLTVPHHLVRSLLPDSLANEPPLAGVDNLKTAPISSVHLWYDRPITSLPHAVLVDRTSQWLFNRTLLAAAAGHGDGRSYYQVV